MTGIPDLIAQLYDTALKSEITLSDTQEGWVNAIVAFADQQKGVLAALITSLVKKIESPNQDIRLHKITFEGGYSGRVFDTQYITPFIRSRFPRLAMKSGSGWLTRSIEQAAPFDLQFPGKIQNAEVKEAFLRIIHDVQVNDASPEDYLLVLFRKLHQKQDAFTSSTSHLVWGNISISQVLHLLRSHFFHDYAAAGASRLPVIAIYSIYQLLMNTPRYQSKRLLPLKSHTTSDSKSMSLADIEVADENGIFFEAVEIKHKIRIHRSMVEDAFEKFSAIPLVRYYLLTTAEPNSIDQEGIQEAVDWIFREHGCEVIVNGIMPSLKYYLRLLPDLSAFIETYTQNLFLEYQASSDLKQIHVDQWTHLLTP